MVRGIGRWSVQLGARKSRKDQGLARLGGRDVAPCKYVDNDVGEVVGVALKLCKGVVLYMMHG